MKKNIELKEINHYYGKAQVLHDVNISIKEGEFFYFTRSFWLWKKQLF